MRLALAVLLAAAGLGLAAPVAHAGWAPFDVLPEYDGARAVVPKPVGTDRGDAIARFEEISHNELDHGGTLRVLRRFDDTTTPKSGPQCDDEARDPVGFDFACMALAETGAGRYSDTERIVVGDWDGVAPAGDILVGDGDNSGWVYGNNGDGTWGGDYDAFSHNADRRFFGGTLATGELWPGSRDVVTLQNRTLTVGQVTGTEFDVLQTRQTFQSSMCDSSALHVADINGDQLDDILVSGLRCDDNGDDDLWDGTEVWLQNGSAPNGERYTLGGFESAQSDGRSLVGLDVAFGDIDGDGDTDMVAGGGFGDFPHTAYAIGLFDETESWDPAHPLGQYDWRDSGATGAPSIAGRSTGVALADLPDEEGVADGALDLVIAGVQETHTDLQRGYVLFGDGSGRFASPLRLPGQAPAPVLVGDFNSAVDSRDDLVFGDHVYLWTDPPTVPTTLGANSRPEDAPQTGTFTTRVNQKVMLGATSLRIEPQDLPADDLSETLDRVEWDFDGNGTVDKTTQGANAFSTDHTYTEPGTFTPKVRSYNVGESFVRLNAPTITVLGAPAVTLAASQDAPGLAEPWTFTASASGGDGTYTYAWTIDDVPVDGATGPTLTHTFTTPGYKDVRVTVTSAGDSASDTERVRAADAFAVTIADAPDMPSVEDVVDLNATTSGGLPGATFDWTRDPLSRGLFTALPATDATEPFRFDELGAVTASVTARDGSVSPVSASDDEAFTVVPKLGVTLTPPVDPAPDEPVTFAAAASGGVGPYTYAWKVGDETRDGQTAATFAPTFDEAGRYDVEVTATDSRGRTATAKVDDLLVAADLGGTIEVDNDSPQLEEEVTFTARPTGGVAPYTLKWDVDGTPGYDEPALTGTTAKHTYTTQGTKTVRLHVTDAEGATKEIERTIGVESELTGAFSITPAQPKPGEQVTFDADDTFGGTPPYTYTWKLDGTTVDGDPGVSFTRTFAAPGRHTLSLVVTDARDRETEALEKAFKVAGPLVARIDASRERPETGEAVTYDATPTTGGLPPLRYRWDLDGDGTYETDGGTDPQRTVTWPAAGTPKLGLQVTDDDGVVAEAQRTVTVATKLRAALALRPEIPAPGELMTFSAAGTVGGTGPVSYTWDLDGDGSYETSTGTTPTATRRYDTPIDVTARVRAADPDEHVSIAEARLTVAPPLKARLAASPDAPETGQELTFDASASSGGAGQRRYAFDLDGDGSFETDTGTSAVARRSYGDPSAPVVRVRVRDERDREDVATAAVDVVAALTPRVAMPARGETGRPVRLDARATTGGTPPLTYRWDLDGNGDYEYGSGTSPLAQTSFRTVGGRELGVQVRDTRGRTRAVRRPIQIVDACVHELTFGLADIRTYTDDTCLTDQGTDEVPKYVTNGPIVLNQQVVGVGAGGTIAVYPPTADRPQGRITSGDAEVVVDGDTVIDGPIDWKLPEGQKGEERTIVSAGLAEDGVTFLGLELEGRVGFSLGIDDKGQSFSRFRGNLAIPGFQINEEEDSPNVTAKVAVRIDAGGPELENILLRIGRAYMGDLKVNDICFSYLARGVDEDTGARCEQFEDFDGEPFLTCDSDSETERWDGTVDIQFPGTEVAVGASGGVSDRELSHLALKAQLNRTVALKPGLVWLKGIAAGVCLKPAPLKVKGSAQIGAVAKGTDDEIIEANGSFEYVDSHNGKPWEIMIRGGMSLEGLNLGNAYLGIDGDATMQFGFHRRLQFPNDDIDLASIDGRVDGWIEARNPFRFNAEAAVEACLAGIICTGGEAVLSTDGVAACVTLFSFTVGYPTVWPPDWEEYEVEVRGGFGYRWGGSLSIMAASCDIGPWRAQRRGQAARAAQTGFRSFTVDKRQPVATVRVHGKDAPPKVVIVGPGGRRIVSPAGKPGELVRDSHLIVENAQDNTTNVQVFKPAAGEWRIEAQPGSTIEGDLDQARWIRPVSAWARVTSGRDGRKRLKYSYTPQSQTRIRLVELSEKAGVRRTIGEVRPGRCSAKVERGQLGEDVACGSMAFTPAYGRGGKRKIVAEIVRNGLVVENRPLTSFVAAPPAKPGRPRALRVTRSARGITVAWAPAKRAYRYEVGAVSTDGYSGVKARSSRCRVLRLPTISKTANVTVTLSAVDRHGERGPEQRLRLRPRAGRAGAGTKRFRIPKRC